MRALRVLTRPPSPQSVDGLKHCECLGAMKLGAPIISLERFQFQNLAMFARWESEDALDTFLGENDVGCQFADGWHVRLSFLRQWGVFPEFGESPPSLEQDDTALPVVAVTIARLKLPEVFRFIRWGKPVEELVRDHPSKTLALAAFRFPRTFSTFSVWRSQQALSEMVFGKTHADGGRRHADAMQERKRREFHHQFATFRFRGIAEHGLWSGRGDYVPR